MPDATSTAALTDNRDEILEWWLQAQREDPRIRGELARGDEARRHSRELLDALVDRVSAVSGEGFTGAAFAELRSRVAGIAERQARLGFEASETAAAIMLLKDRWIHHVLRAGGEAEDLAMRIAAISRLVDRLALATHESLIAQRQEVIERQAQELVELSTPVVRVWEGVVATPLIGTLDSERTQHFMERLLNSIVQTRSQIALVDITGVPAIDTQTAHHLIETVSAVRLLGAQVILTGVRPSIAQTLVHLGIDLSDITTRASFSGGLRVAMDMLGLAVTETVSR